VFTYADAPSGNRAPFRTLTREKSTNGKSQREIAESSLFSFRGHCISFDGLDTILWSDIVKEGILSISAQRSSGLREIHWTWIGWWMEETSSSSLPWNSAAIMICLSYVKSNKDCSRIMLWFCKSWLGTLYRFFWYDGIRCSSATEEQCPASFSGEIWRDLIEAGGEGVLKIQNLQSL